MKYQATISADRKLLNAMTIGNLKQSNLFTNCRWPDPDAYIYNAELDMKEYPDVHIQITPSGINITFGPEREMWFLYRIVNLLLPFLEGSDNKRLGLRLQHFHKIGSSHGHKSLSSYVPRSPDITGSVPFFEYIILNFPSKADRFLGRAATKVDRIEAMRMLALFMSEEFGRRGAMLARECMTFALNHDTECINKGIVSESRVKEVLREKYFECSELNDYELPRCGVREYRINLDDPNRRGFLDYVQIYCCACVQSYLNLLSEGMGLASEIFKMMWWYRNLLPDLKMKEPSLFDERPYSLHHQICLSLGYRHSR